MSERSDHEDALADHLSDGGGCLETAQAAAEFRNEELEYTRRSLLSTIAGLGATAPLPNQEQATTTPQAVDPDNVEIVETTGNLRKLWMNRAIEQDTVQLVGTAISRNPYEGAIETPTVATASANRPTTITGFSP